MSAECDAFGLIANFFGFIEKRLARDVLIIFMFVDIERFGHLDGLSFMFVNLAFTYR